MRAAPDVLTARPPTVVVLAPPCVGGAVGLYSDVQRTRFVSMNLNLLDVDRLSVIPVWVVLVGVVVLLAFESGSLLGLFTPGNSVPITLGVLASIGVVPWLAAVLLAAGASSGGAQYAFSRCRRSGTVLGLGRIEPRVPRFILRFVGRLSTQADTRPLLVAAGGHLVGGVRTVVPRLLAATTIGRREYGIVSVGAAFVWSATLVTLGSWLGSHETVRLVLGYAWIPALTVMAATQLRRRTRASSPELVVAR